MRGNRFFKKKGKKGCLLIHGLTSSTQEFEELGTYLHTKGYTVLATLLKGHNTSPEDLGRTTWKDWYNSVIEDFYFLEKKCDEIYIIGQSIGATLALHMVSNTDSKKIKGLILLAPAISYSNYTVYLIPLLKYFKKYTIKDYRKYYPHRKEAFFDIADDKQLEKRIAYKKVPLSSIASALGLIRLVKKEIKKIKISVITFHSRKDHTIKPSSSIYIYNKLKSQKKLIFVEKSGHVLSVDYDKNTIFREIYGFIQKK